MTDGNAARLQHEVVTPLKQRFVGRDGVIDLIALALVAGEHLFLLGPPGTAKSALIRHFASAVQGRYFEYMLTRFSEPNEIFGPIDIVRLREGTVATVTTGMLPEAEFVFLDELFNANSAILNNLLTVLNERIYRRGAETHRLPLLSLFSASNHLPEDEALQALFDRFLLRCQVLSLKREQLPELLAAGWALEHAAFLTSAISADDLRALTAEITTVELEGIRDRYVETVVRVRDLGINLSDRRAVKVLKLLAASAVLCGRRAATLADFWVLRYVWDRVEQIDPLAALVNGVLEQAPEQGARHPLSKVPAEPDGEDLARQLEEAGQDIQAGTLSLTQVARLRERIAGIADQATWLKDAKHRTFLQDRARELLNRLGV